MNKKITITLFIALLIPRLLYAQVTGSDMESKTHNLNEVVVVGDIVKKDASKETIFISDSLRKGTVNAIQLLSKIHGVTIDWGTDEIKIGKERNVPVIVNGREMTRDYVININPKRIRKVEIMRYPAGKYSDCPVILNLVLANDYVGWDVNGISRGMYSFRNRHSNRESVGADFTYSLDRIIIYGNIRVSRRQAYDAVGYEYSDGGSMSVKTDMADYKNPNISAWSKGGEFSMGVDYKITDAHSLSLQAWYDKKDAKDEEHYDVMKGEVSHIQQTLNNYDTDDYTLGLFYKGILFDGLRVSSELIYNGYDIHETCLFSDNGTESHTPYRGEKKYWRYYLSASYALNRYWSLTADYTQTWKDYSNKEQTSGETLYKSSETRSKAMAALSYKPSRYFSIMAGTHFLTVRNDNELAYVSERHTSWMPILKSYWRPAKFVSLLLNYYCDVEYPNLDQLSTVEWQVNDVLWHTGNSSLKPRVMHYSELSVSFANIIKINYMLKHCRDEIVDYYIQDGNKTFQTQTNCNFLHNYLGIEGEYQLAKGLDLSLVGSYQWYNRHIKNSNRHFGKTWYLDSQMSWNIPKTKLSIMAGYFLRHDKFPLLQGRQYNEEESLILAASYSLRKGRMPISIGVKIPTELISKQTYTQIDLPCLKYYSSGNNRVNAFCATINIKYNLGKGKISRNYNNKNTDTEK